MKRQVVLLLLLISLISSCAGCNWKEQEIPPTDGPCFEYHELYLMYGDELYSYPAEGEFRWLDGEAEIEARGFTRIAEVALRDDHAIPSKHLQATQMDVGTPIYAGGGDGALYVLLFDGILWRLVPCSVEAEPSQSLTPTGYPSGEYQHIYLLYNGVMYTYDTTGTGRWEAGEAQAESMGLSKVAEVELVDNHNPPTENLQATRLTVGDPIYAREGEDCVYVLLENGTLWRLNPCSAADDPRNG